MTRGNILLVTSNYPRWCNDSTTPFIHFLATDLLSLGWRITILAPHAPGAKRQEILDGISIKRFPYFWPSSQQTVCYQGGALINLRQKKSNGLKLPFLVLAEFLALIRELNRNTYDLLHTHWLLPQGFVGVLAGKLYPIPHVTTIHGGDVFALSGNTLAQFKKLALKHANAVTVNSSVTEQAARELLPSLKNIFRIPMGAASPPPGTKKNAEVIRTDFPHPLVVYAGRIIQEKGINELLESLPLLISNYPSLHLLLIGEGQDQLLFTEKTKQLGIQKHVTFTGWVTPENIPAYMTAADVFVSPSWHEGQGLTFIEAMLAGTPVIGTNVGGIPDAVIHEKTGLLVDLHAPEQIAAAVSRYLANPQWTESIKKTARRHAESHFTRAASARAFSDLFQQLIEAKTPRQ